MEIIAGNVISTILKHDNKVTSYKIALLRAVNDVVLAFPDLIEFDKDVAIPLRVLARFWLAYYWPFFDRDKIILQGPRAIRGGIQHNDMAFREELKRFRFEWTSIMGESILPADGFFIINDLSIPRKRNSYPKILLRSYDITIRKICNTIKMPIRYAGDGEWTVFEKPKIFSQQMNNCISVPGTQSNDVCLIINKELWKEFLAISLYIEALCIHEWSLFTERKNKESNPDYERGFVYRLLTERPDNRRPLTWERNQIDILLMEKKIFVCPWTERKIRYSNNYDIDHIIPVSAYPINELWNLAPSDPHYNSHTKRNRIPSLPRLRKAYPHLKLTYENYVSFPTTKRAVYEDALYRFKSMEFKTGEFVEDLTDSVIKYIDQLGNARNLARF